MREYETTFIVQPEISDEGGQTILSKLDGVLETGGAVRLMCEDHGKRKLAYEVRKFHKGHYYTLMFLDEGTVVPALERTLRLEESVLRFLTILASDEVADIEARKTEAAEAEDAQTKRAEERAVREAEEATARRVAEEAEREAASLRAAEEAKAKAAAEAAESAESTESKTSDAPEGEGTKPAPAEATSTATETKPEAKADTKPETKSETKSEAKSETKAATKTADVTPASETKTDEPVAAESGEEKS